MEALRSFLNRRYGPRFPWGHTTPDDIVDFLLIKEKNGRTQVHIPSCRHAGSARRGDRVSKECDPSVCELRTSLGSVKATISNLKSGFARVGIMGEWSNLSRSGNPCTSPTIQDHVKAITRELAASAVAPVQAPPIPDSEYELVLRFLSRAHTGIPMEWLYNQQMLFFLKLLHTLGRRPDDVAQLRSVSFQWAPDRDSIVVCMFQGKTNHGIRVDRVLVKRNTAKRFFCVVAQLEAYQAAIGQTGMDLSSANHFVFFLIDRRQRDWIADLTCHTEPATFNERFQSILQRMGMWEGQSLYGFRVMAALVASWNSDDIRDVMDAGGWLSAESAHRYSQWAFLAKNASDPEASAEVTRAWLQSRPRFGAFC